MKGISIIFNAMQHLTLNPDKVKPRFSSLTSIGHVLTDKGFMPDPEKTKATVDS